MSLQLLPKEILFNVSDHLDNVHDINALAQTSRFLYRQVNGYLYQFDKQIEGIRLCDWTRKTVDWGRRICTNRPGVSSDILFNNQVKLDADASLYIGSDGKVDGNALYYAIRWNHMRTAEVLIQNGSAVKSRIPDPSEWIGLPKGKAPPGYFRDTGIDIERGFIDYLTPLDTAVQYGRESVVRLLLDQGANFQGVILTDFYSDATLLHIASWYGDVAIVRMLLERGADTEARSDEYEETPLFWAMLLAEPFPALRHKNRENKWKVVQLLLDYGADPAAKNWYGCRFDTVDCIRACGPRGPGCVWCLEWSYE